MKVVTIKTQGSPETFINRLKYIRNQQPKMSRKVMRQFGEELRSQLVKSAFRVGITPFTSNNFGTIRWQQPKNSNEGVLVMPQHLVHLDSVTPSYKKWYVTQSQPELMNWAIKKGYMPVKRNALRVRAGKQSSFPLRLRRYPFIRPGWNKARRKLPKYIEKELESVKKNV